MAEDTEERYKIIKLISKDPAGGVYLAEDSMLGRKVMFRHIDTEPDDNRPQTWAKEMASYAGKLCTFQHPNIVTIYDAPADKDGVSMVTQYVEGETLAECLQQGPLPESAVHRMASDLLDALHAAHDAGVYHGALHTGSIARLPRASGGHRYIILDIGLNTLATMVKGRDVHIADPVLLPPELNGEDSEPDESADLFMVGQLCYTAMAGGHPFSGKSAEAAAAAHLAGELPPLREYAPQMQEDFEAWVMKMAAAERSARPASIKEATGELHKITINEPGQNVLVAELMPVARPLPAGELVRVAKPVLVAGQDTPVAKLSSATTGQPMKVAKLTGATTEQPVKVATLTAATTQQPVKVATMPTAGAPTSPPTQTIQGSGDFLATTDNSNKTMIVVIASLLGAVVLGAALYFLLGSGGDGGDQVKPTSELPPPAEGVKAHLHEVELIGRDGEMGMVKLDGEKTLDWVVMTGATAAGPKRQKQGRPYQISPSTAGRFSEVSRDGMPVFFTVGENEISPKAATPNAQNGNGWSIRLKVLKTHKDPMIVSLYMFQTGCGFELKVTMHDGKEIEFSVPRQEPGVLRIPIEIPKPRKQGFYAIEISAKEASGALAMGLNAVVVEKR